MMEGVGKSIEHAILALVSGGPIGVIVAAVLVAAVIAFILFARSRAIFEDQEARAAANQRVAALDQRVADFQTALMDEVRGSREREIALREETRAITAQLYLMREQLRRLIEQIRLVKTGKLSIDELSLDEPT